MGNERHREAGSVLVLSQHYRPEPNFITADVAERLARYTRVTVVTAHPNYPFGRFYDGVRPWKPTRSVENGVVVWRLPFFPYHGTSKLGRMVSYLSFALAAALFAPFVAGRPRLVWVYHGPFTVVLAALWFKLLGARVVLTCADLWPESFTASGVARPGRLMRLMFAYRRATNRWMDGIICSTRGTLEQFASEGVPRRAMHFVPVWTDGVAAPGAAPAADAADDCPAVVYAGNLGPAQHLETVIHAAALLERQGVRVRFDLYGAGASEAELRALAEREGARSVRFMGRVTPAEAFAVSAGAFAQLVCLRPTPLFRMTIPSKLPFSFAAGAPVLYGLEGESAELARDSGGAIAFDPLEPATLAAAVRQLLGCSDEERAAMRRLLQSYYREHFARDHLIERYGEILLGMPAERSAAPAPRAAAGERPAPVS